MSEHLTFHNTSEQRESGHQPTVLLERSRTGEIVTATATGQLDKDGLEYYTFVENSEEKAKPLGRNTLSDQMQDELVKKLVPEHTPPGIETGEQEPIPTVAVELGDVALARVGVEAPSTVETRVEGKTGLTIDLVNDLARRLAIDARVYRESFGQSRGIDKAIDMGNLIEAYTSGRVSDQDVSVVSGALIGSSKNRHDIEAVFNGLASTDVIDTSELNTLSKQLSQLEETVGVAGERGDQVKVGYVNSLIGKTESLLDENDRKPTAQYRVLLGLIVGLSSQIENQSISNNYISGAISQIRKADTESHEKY